MKMMMMTKPVNLLIYVVVSDRSCGLLGHVGLESGRETASFIKRLRYSTNNDFLSYGCTSHLSIVFMSVYLV